MTSGPFPGAGELAAFASALAWGAATVLFARSIAQGSSSAAVLFKNTTGAIALGVFSWLLGEHRGGGFKCSRELYWLLGSGAIGLGLGDWLYFESLRRIGAVRTVLFAMLTPVMTALLAWLILEEPLSGWQWIGVLLVVGGGMLAECRRPKTKAQSNAILIGISIPFVFSVGTLMTHWGLEETGAVSASAIRLLGGSLVLLAMAGCKGRLLPLLKASFSAKALRLYSAPSVLGTWLGMTLVMAGLTWAKQGVASALSAALPLCTLPLAWHLLGERPSRLAWWGSGILAIGVATLGLAS